MENASKALLIAAAVLIAIVVIALGVRLLSSTADVSKNAEDVSNSISDASTKAYASIFNAQFEPYINKTVSGDKVLELMDKVIATKDTVMHIRFYPNKSNNTGSIIAHQIEYEDNEPLYKAIKNAIDKNSKYDISIRGCTIIPSGYDSNERIRCIDIRGTK